MLRLSTSMVSMISEPEHHQHIVHVFCPDLQGMRLYPVALKAHGFIELLRRQLRGGHKSNLLEPLDLPCAPDDLLHHRLAGAFASQLRAHVHAPNVPLMAFLLVWTAEKTSCPHELTLGEDADDEVSL